MYEVIRKSCLFLRQNQQLSENSKVPSSNCDCVISVCTGKAECKQRERGDEKQPPSYSYRRFRFTRLLQ